MHINKSLYHYLMTDRFTIYRNIPKASDIKIHHIDCKAYTGRNLLAENSDWHTAPDIGIATSIAQKLAREHSMTYRDCKWCTPSYAVDTKSSTVQRTAKTHQYSKNSETPANTLSLNSCMTATAWNNGSHHESGAGYGIKIKNDDRDKYFKKEWQTVYLQPCGQSKEIEVNVDKSSFWNGSCGELIHKEIGMYLIKNRKGYWEEDNPPEIRLEPLGNRRFSFAIM